MSIGSKYSGMFDYNNLEYQSFSTYIKLCKATIISTQHNYTDFESFKFYQYQQCQLKRNPFQKFDCVLISSIRTRSYFLVQFDARVTWIDADETCKSIGGYLPIFNSRKNLNELLHAVRYAKINYPILNTYTGLRYNKVGEILLCEINMNVAFVVYAIKTLNTIGFYVARMSTCFVSLLRTFIGKRNDF